MDCDLIGNNAVVTTTFSVWVSVNPSLITRSTGEHLAIRVKNCINNWVVRPVRASYIMNIKLYGGTSLQDHT